VPANVYGCRRYAAAEDPETVEQYRAVAVAVSAAATSLTDILANLRLLNATAAEASGTVSDAEHALDRVQQQIDNAQMILDDDVHQLLREAMHEQREAGQQSEQLTEMAHEARQTVERYVLRACVNADYTHKRGTRCRPVSVRLSCLSVTPVYCIQTAKVIVKRSYRPDSPIILVFTAQAPLPNFNHSCGAKSFTGWTSVIGYNSIHVSVFTSAYTE